MGCSRGMSDPSTSNTPPTTTPVKFDGTINVPILPGAPGALSASKAESGQVLADNQIAIVTYSGGGGLHTAHFGPKGAIPSDIAESNVKLLFSSGFVITLK